MNELRKRRGKPRKVPEILANEELISQLYDMAENGASKAQFLVAMGVSKGASHTWENKNSAVFDESYLNLISELTLISQSVWEEVGGINSLFVKDFNAALYDKAMRGRFKDWRNQSFIDLKSENKTTVLSEDLKKHDEEVINNYLKNLTKE